MFVLRLESELGSLASSCAALAYNRSNPSGDRKKGDIVRPGFRQDYLNRMR